MNVPRPDETEKNRPIRQNRTGKGKNTRALMCIIPLLLHFLTPVIFASLLEEANSLYTAGKPAQALGLYKRALTAGENPALCYFNLANAYFQLDSVPQSIVYYQAALEQAPDFFRGYLNLAISYYTLEDMGGSIAAITRALELEPGNVKALLLLAVSYRRAGALPEAVVTFEQLLQIDPRQDDAYIALGEMYRELQDAPTALLWLNRYPDDGKNEPYVYTLMVDMYEQEGQLDKALFYLQKAVQKDPQNRTIRYRLCLMYDKMGNDLVAYEESTAALHQFPDFEDVALFAGNTACKLGNYGEAEHYYTIARKLGSAGAIVGLENIHALLRQQAAEKNTPF